MSRDWICFYTILIDCRNIKHFWFCYYFQNVLKQMGLNVVTLDGLLIHHVRTFILRCYACFKTTSLMDKIFFPNCGNKTLKRVAVTVDNDGKEIIHINFRKPLTSRGKKVRCYWIITISIAVSNYSFIKSFRNILNVKN